MIELDMKTCGEANRSSCTNQQEPLHDCPKHECLGDGSDFQCTCCDLYCEVCHRSLGGSTNAIGRRFEIRRLQLSKCKALA